MPLIPSTYRPPYLFPRSGHVQSIYPHLFRQAPRPDYIRERLATPDDDFVDLDWVRIGATRVVILLHGLEGSSQSKYMRAAASELSRQGWDVVALNFRGCSGEPNRLLRAYHSGETGDLAHVIQHIEALDQYRDLGLIGFSLGGNVVLKYLGERGTDLPAFLRGAATCSVPCDLVAACEVIEKSAFGLYRWDFLQSLRKKAQVKAHLLPKPVDFASLKTLRAFDDAFTAPIHGFADATEYWTSCSSKYFLAPIALPTLIINAKNDPFLAPACFPEEIAKKHSHLSLEIPKMGGHVGFIHQWGKKTYWIEERLATFVSQWAS